MQQLVRHSDRPMRALFKFVAPNNGYSPEYRIDLSSSSSGRSSNKPATRQQPINPPEQRVVNRRTEEIQRIKANNPDISHREAFSTAAKNWAHFPHIHFGLMLESNNNQSKLDEGQHPSSECPLESNVGPWGSKSLRAFTVQAHLVHGDSGKCPWVSD
ncbi:hypothetical protein AG4045_006646 [Apium graveolens]|uniref:YABBY protein C-terminal domain-containing protein n=1 Tax=Apium graveolens TaxID=4045 RepID=A0A6L5BBJ1_APIGR|nr:hypothetical protein AG4045_006646 [Apium graveolens]